jgi:hypothetical protein
MGMEHWQNDTNRQEQKNTEKNLSQCHSVYHKTHTDWPEGETKPQKLKVGLWHSLQFVT